MRRVKLRLVTGSRDIGLHGWPAVNLMDGVYQARQCGEDGTFKRPFEVLQDEVELGTPLVVPARCVSAGGGDPRADVFACELDVFQAFAVVLGRAGEVVEESDEGVDARRDVVAAFAEGIDSSENVTAELSKSVHVFEDDSEVVLG